MGNQKEKNDKELMNKVNQAFDDMVQDVRSMVQEKESKQKET